MQHLTSYQPFVSQVIHAHSLLQSHNFVTGDHDCSKGTKNIMFISYKFIKYGNKQIRNSIQITYK